VRHIGASKTYEHTTAMQFETLVAISAVLLAFLLYSTHNRTGLPRVGKGGPLGFILTALKSITSFADLIDEGLNKYGGKAFVLPSMTGSFVLVGPENVDVSCVGFEVNCVGKFLAR
jgi:hypothetical protein